MKKKILAGMLAGLLLNTFAVSGDILTAQAVQNFTAAASISKASGTNSFAATVKGQKSSNIHYQEYYQLYQHLMVYNYFHVVNSYLKENSDGTLTRVENIGSKVVVENFDIKGNLGSTKSIAPALPIFGGAFMGEKYYFLVFGQENPEHNNNAETVRVCKYSKNWKLLDSLSLSNNDTAIPFNAGTLRMAETNGKLFIHTCHEKYSAHQSNMSFVIDEETLRSVSSDVNPLGYMSHSFNQIVKTDGEYVYTVDHGDAFDRCLRLNKTGVNNLKTEELSLYDIYGEIGDNYTGVCLGGFELSADNCLTAYSNIKSGSFESNKAKAGAYSYERTTKNVYVAVTPKSLSSTKIVEIASYSDNSDISIDAPHLVKINDNDFVIMWEERDSEDNITVKFARIDGNGNLTSDEIGSSETTALSDCQPIYCSDGMIRWYVTEGSAPTMYAINPDRLSSIDADIAVSSTILGDTNGDNSLDIKDVIRLQKYINDPTIEITNPDINGDGDINIKDVIRLQKMINEP